MSADLASVGIVAEACRILGRLDVTHGSLGHVSQRLGDSERMLIKGKGPGEVGLRYTQDRDIITVDFAANKLSGADDLQPPSESYIHIWLYRLRPDVRSVIHVHPEHAVLLTICDKPVLPIYGAYGPGARLAIEGVRVYPRTITINDDRWGEDFARFVGSSNVALMRSHGASVVGTSVEDATVRTMQLNELVTMNYKAYLLGTPKPIPEDEQAHIAAPLDPTRPRGSSGGEAGTRAAWRYYSALASDRPGGMALAPPQRMPEPQASPIEDAEDEDAADLPDRRAMSLLDPGSLLGGTGGGLPLGGNPTAAPGGATGGGALGTPSAPASPIPLPNVPLPAHNAGGAYTPDSTAHT